MVQEVGKRKAMLRLREGPWGGEGVPAAFFMHFGPEFHRGDVAVRRHEEFFRFTGMDLAKVQLELPFPACPVERPGDWERLPALDEAFFAPQLEVVKGIVAAVGQEAVVVLTLYSPFMIAGRMGGGNSLAAHLVEDPAAVARGFEIIVEGLGRFGRACLAAGLDGFYHSTQGGESGRFRSPETFERWIKPADLALLSAIGEGCRFNVLHVCDYHRDQVGGYGDLGVFEDYPGHVVCCPDEGLGTAGIARRFGRPVLGGMDRLGPLATGTEDQIRAEARKALAEAPDRFILGADCTVPNDTPWENLRAAVDEAHNWRG